MKKAYRASQVRSYGSFAKAIQIGVFQYSSFDHVTHLNLVRK